jgi:hypothetical protein
VTSDLGALITRSHSAAVAEAYRAFDPNKTLLALLADTGKDVLSQFPWMPGGCAIMSAVYVARLQMFTDAPVFAVAGELSVGDVCIFGKEASEPHWEAAFTTSDVSWDGHCWVAFGDYVADISIFRTAYSQVSPPLLARHIAERFGRGRGLLICRPSDFSQLGMSYRPRYVLKESQVTGLFLEAKAIFDRQV